MCTPAPYPRLNPAFAKIRGRALGVGPNHVPLLYRAPCTVHSEVVVNLQAADLLCRKTRLDFNLI